MRTGDACSHLGEIAELVDVDAVGGLRFPLTVAASWLGYSVLTEGHTIFL